MSGAARPRGRRWLILPLIAATALAAIFFHPLARLAFQFLLAAAIAACAKPLSARMETRLPRGAAALIAVISILLIFGGLVALALPFALGQISLVIAQAPALLSQASEFLAQYQWLGISSASPEEWLARGGAWAAKMLPQWLAALGAATDALSRAFIAPVLGYYLLRDREYFIFRYSMLIPIRYRRRALSALREMRREAGGYLRGQIAVAGCVAAMTALGLFAVGVPSWLALGVIMGVCEMIPYVGPLIGAIPIALFSLPMGLTKALAALLVTFCVQQIEGVYLSPRLMGGATSLHPAHVLLLLSAGGLVFGLPGMLLVIPLFVSARGAARILYGTK